MVIFHPYIGMVNKLLLQMILNLRICSGCAADGFKHWAITANGGDQFVVEADQCPGSERVSTIGIPGELCLITVTSYVPDCS